MVNNHHDPRRRIILLAMALIAALATGPAAFAWQVRQPPGSGRGPVRGGSTASREPLRGGGSGTTEGTYKGYIVRYESAQDAVSEDLIGYLSIKSEEKGAKTLKLRVHRRNGLVINMGGFKMDLENAPEVLLKGLYCSANWDYEPTEGKKKPTQKELVALSLETFDVEGTVDSLADDRVILKARPISGDWPGALEKNQPARGNEKPKTVVQKKLELKTVENVTKYTKAGEVKPGDQSDFEPGQDIEATVVYGRSKLGMILSLRPPGTTEGGHGQQQTQGGRGGSRPRPQPPTGGGGRKPGGG